MANQNLIYQIGITLVKGVGSITAKQIIEALGDVSLLFTEKKHLLERIPGISRQIISGINDPEILRRAENEIRFIEKKQYKALFITDPDYPQRLRECVDAPTLLYYNGNADLNSGKIVSIVGTRNATTYGKEMTEKLVHGIKEVFPETLIISGLAYGIDIAAHKAALKEDMSTVGVLAHGLDRIYPPSHKGTADEMLRNGGLLTEFMSNTNPDRQNFVRRNRIVAGMSDCTVVVESGEKGGALITANIAESYNKDVFAFPGKVSDKYSAGCNSLIQYNKAALITCAEDLFRGMNWTNEHTSKPKQVVQRTIFLDLPDEEQSIVDILSQEENIQLNTLSIRLNLPISKLSAILFELEMKGIIRCKPGGIYELI